MAAEGIMVIGAAIAGAFAILAKALANAAVAEDEDGDEGHKVQVATGESSNKAKYGFDSGLKASITDNESRADVNITSSGPARSSRARKQYQKGNSPEARTNADTCDHCGAMNGGRADTCWSCGSAPEANIGADGLASVNRQLRNASADTGYEVKKGESPQDKPATSPAIPSDDSGSDSDDFGTDEQDVRDREEPSVIHRLIGGIFGWIEKWLALTNTHLYSIGTVAFATLVVWTIAVIYGTVRFGRGGLVAVIGATVFAVLSAGLCTLCYLAPGRIKTVGLAYPFALSALFLPPVVVAMYEPSFSVVLQRSTDVANYTANNFLAPIGLEQLFRETFELEGANYLVMWLAVSFPLGWALGTTRYAVPPAIAKILSATDSLKKDSNLKDSP